jgi:photosystem II stability/assembly factor-like uncharacterized protein
MNIAKYFLLFFLALTACCRSQTWKVIPTPLADISCIRSDPHRPGTVYFVGRGVIAGTSDGGASWFYKGFSDYSNVKPADLLLDAQDSMRWYMCVAEAGYMLSTDAGASWRYLNDDLHFDDWTQFRKIVQDESRPEFLYLVSRNALYRSSDRGNSWKMLLSDFGRNGNELTNVVIHRNRPDSLFLFAGAEPKRWVSADRGANWTTGNSLIGRLGTCTFGKDNELLVGPYRSTDYGASWTKHDKIAGISYTSSSNNYPPGSESFIVYNRTLDRYYMSSRYGLLSRRSGEQEWSIADFTMENDTAGPGVQMICYDTSSATIWGTSRARILRYSITDMKSRYMDSGPYLSSTGFFSSPTSHSDIIMTEYGGSYDGGKTWRWTNPLVMADQNLIMVGAIKPDDSTFMLWGATLLAYTKDGPILPYDAGWTTSKVTPGEFMGAIRFNPHNTSQVFGGQAFGLWRMEVDTIVHKTQNSNGSNYRITPPVSAEGVPGYGFIYRAMCFHPELDGVYYLCSWEHVWGGVKSTLWRTTDFGATWNALLDQYPYPYNDVIVNPSRPELILVGSGRNGILRSTDEGRTWTANYGPPFQSASVQHIIVDPRYHNVYYCGTYSTAWHSPQPVTGRRSGGMYVSYDYGETWEALPLDGMHNVSVRFIHYHENPRRLIVSTWAGIYEMLLPDYATNTEPLPLSAGLELRVYPNPVHAGDMQTLRVYGAGGKHALVDLYSMQGRHIARVHEGVLEAGATLRQSTAGLPSGMYYYRVISGGEQRSVPVVIRK